MYLDQGNITVIVAFSEVRMAVDCTDIKCLFSVLRSRQGVSTQHNLNAGRPPATNRTFIILQLRISATSKQNQNDPSKQITAI